MENKETKKCPYCGEIILAQAKKCRFCGEWLTSEPMQQQPMMQQQPPMQQQPMQQQPMMQQQQPMQQQPMMQQQQPMQQQPMMQQPMMQQPMMQQPMQQQPMQQPMQQQPMQQPTMQEEPMEEEPIDDTYDDCDEEEMSFFEAYITNQLIYSYADFSSCICRRDFWLCVLSWCILSLGVTGLSLILMTYVNEILGMALLGLFGLGMIVPQLALGAERLRDAGKSPWLLLLGLVPFASIVLLIFFCMPTADEDEDANAYDSSLKAPIDPLWMGGSVVLFIVSIVLLFTNIFSSFGNDYDFSDFDDDDEWYAQEATYEPTYDEPAEYSAEEEDTEVGIDTISLSGEIVPDIPIEMVLYFCEGEVMSGRVRYSKQKGPWIEMKSYTTEMGQTILYEMNNGKEVGMFEGRLDFLFRGGVNFEGWHTNILTGKQRTFSLYGGIE